MRKISLLGAGLIGNFYATALLGQRSQDRISIVCAVTQEEAHTFAVKHKIPRWTDSIEQAITDSETDLVVVGLPNFLHKKAVLLAAQAGKAVLCTKPLGLNAAEAKEMLDAVEKASVFHGYLEDLVYTPKTLKSIQSVNNGALGRILWTRSREAHSGPHSDWFWNKKLSGGGAIVDMGCHCIEIGRSFVGKDILPVEVVCWADTQVHPIAAEDSAVGLVRYENGAIAQFEVSWTFRGGMDLRDEVAGTEGTIWLNHWLRTGIEMFTSAGQGGYIAEKAEGQTGWLFPVGDEVAELGYKDMFDNMLDSLEKGVQPVETFYDGYVVNAIMDACYRSAESKKWEPVQLALWRGQRQSAGEVHHVDYDQQYLLVKEELLPDGKTRLILKDKHTGEIVQKYQENKPV